MDENRQAIMRIHHRSISQLLAHYDEFIARESGIDNPALEQEVATRSSLYSQFDPVMSETTGYTTAAQHPLDGRENTVELRGNVEDEDTQEEEFSCLPDFHFPMMDSEYDETLGIPDSITILSTAGHDPILVERKETDDTDDDNANSEHCDSDGLPFNSIYASGVKFKSFHRKAFIPCEEIRVRILDYDRTVTTHFLSPNLYKIQISHGNFSWIIKRRYKHFNSLHQQLSFYRTSLNIPLPMKSHKEKRATIKSVAIQMADEDQKKELKANHSFKSNNSVLRSSTIKSQRSTANGTTKVAKKPVKKKRKLPRFPNRPESLIPEEALPARMEQLEEYLYNLLNSSLYRNHHETLNFVEVSNISFVAGLGMKGKEGLVQKRTGSIRPSQAGCNFCGLLQQGFCVRCSFFCSDVIYGQWRNRWFFVKETCFGYIRPSDGSIRAVVLFDHGFDVSTGIYQTGMRKGLQIITNSRFISIKCWTRRRCKEWMQYLKQTAVTHARDFTQQNRYMSFAPVRVGIQASWYVDGATFMSAVADAIEHATEEIYIADWWLSPEIYMKRPSLDGDYWRLDIMLMRKARQGVKIFVLLYKEVEIAVGLNSFYTKQRLVGLHENIKVLRHPDHAKAGVFFFAHHEKVVAIDQTYAFIGGLDLAYGRWDDVRHRLVDLGSISTSTISVNNKQNDSCNMKEEVDSAFGSRNSSRTKVESSKQKVKEEKIAARPNFLNIKEKSEGMEMQTFTSGDKIMIPDLVSPSNEVRPLEMRKLNTPELERRNMLDKLKSRGKEFVHKLTSTETVTDGVEAIYALNMAEMPFPHYYEDELQGQSKYWIGKDYTNFIVKDLMNLNEPFEDNIDRSTTPRMPWHDIGLCVQGAAARDVSRHFIQRWNAVKLEKVRDNNSFPYLMPKTYNEIKLNPNINQKSNSVTCQILRSVSSWSCGFIEQDIIEQSIHEAYVDTILKAQHYIYIENQFFVTMQMAAMGTTNSVKNQIGQTLFKRILRAHKERKKFRVYVVMPLLPGFEGDVGGSTGNVVRCLLHYNYQSISRGRNSIIQRLKDSGIKDPSEYIGFFSLRTHSQLNNIPITELIYVHSKLLIADDKVVICGSANINDRSLIGKRDSEIAAVLTDEEFENGVMNGEKYLCGKYAGRLRKYLFMEHLGLLRPNKKNINVLDPLSDKFWRDTWGRIATENTAIYDEVFKCIPTDNIKSYADFNKYQEDGVLAKTDPEKATKRLENIQGFLVNLPLEFLLNETLKPPNTSKEGLLRSSVWT